MNRKNPEEIMMNPHWAIVSNVGTYHEGDQRSRDAPGHGYAAHTSYSLEYTPYETEIEAIDALKRKGASPFKVIYATPLTVQTETTLKTTLNHG